MPLPGVVRAPVLLMMSVSPDAGTTFGVTVAGDNAVPLALTRSWTLLMVCDAACAPETPSVAVTANMTAPRRTRPDFLQPLAISEATTQDWVFAFQTKR